MRSTTPRRGLLLAALVTALASVACGASASLSPTAPSGVGSPSSAGATISGQVNHGSGLALTTTASTSGAITVTVVGTNVSATVDGLGRFTLTGLPGGTLQLQFSGPGTNATLTISSVEEQDQIQIAVTVNGNSVVLESQHRSSNGNRVDVEGRITAVDAAARTLQVAGIQVNVPASAVIRRGSGGSQTLQFSDLSVGIEVKVRGTREGAVITATEIRVESERQGRLDELKGAVSGLSGTCPTLSFTVQGSAARTNGATFFKKASCAQVQNGATVEVKGERQADGSLLAVQVELEDDVNEMKLKGMVSGLTGTCPSLRFVVNAMTVVTNSSTRFEDPCSGVQNGRRVEVEGIRQANGELLAGKVETEEDEVNEIELKGAVSAVTGACPSLRFVVNAVTVVTNSSTRFEDPCSGVQNGRRVEVKGIRQANGEVLARKVETEEDQANNNETELKGAVSGLTGTCPSLRFVVNAVTVVTNSSTRFEDPCSGVQNGRRVEVKGIRQANGEVLAQKVETEEDQVNNNEIELKGAVSGLTGTCPSLRFVVNAVTVVTNSSTRFDEGCSSVQNTRRVEVKGTRQANGEVLARRVESDN